MTNEPYKVCIKAGFPNQHDYAGLALSMHIYESLFELRFYIKGQAIQKAL
jgi:hypothetical protein